MEAPAGAQRTSRGRVYAQQAAQLDEGSPSLPSPSTCCHPTASQADALAALFIDEALAAVSIGAGEGYAEAQLEQRGVVVTAVEIDAFSDASRYATSRRFCSEIRRIRPDELFEIEEPHRVALCFMWGRALPWRQYLQHYPQVPMVVIAGDPSRDAEPVTEPAAHALDGEDGWTRLFSSPVQAPRPDAVLVVFKRASNASSRHKV